MNVSLAVFSEWEKILTVYGWLLNNFITELLFSSGIVLIVLAGVLFSARSASVDSRGTQKQLEVRVAIVTIVLLFAFFPTLKINDVAVLHTAHHCPKSNDRVETPVISAQTKQQLDTEMSDLRIPVVWAFLHKLSAGIAYQIATSLDCFTDWTEIETVVRTNKIQDPAIVYEYSLFASRCYAQARYQYQTLGLQDSVNLPKADDLTYIGSRYYLATSGYYSDFLLPAHVARWQPNLVRSCQAWWEGEGVNKGLKYVLLDQATRQLSEGELSNILSLDGEEQQDFIIKAMLKSNPPNWESVAGTGVKATSHFGLNRDDISERISSALSQSYFLKKLVIYVQPLLLLTLYLLVPLFILGSCLSVKGILYYAVWFVSVQAIPTIYQLTSALDARIIEDLYQGLSLANADLGRLITAYIFTYLPFVLLIFLFLGLIRVIKANYSYRSN